MQIAIFTKEIGKMIKQMELEFIFNKMVANMKDNGKIIKKMDKEKKNGLMEPNIKDAI
jgi:hypothetical protein